MSRQTTASAGVFCMLLWLAANAVAASCGLDSGHSPTGRVSSQTHELWYRFVPAEFPVGKTLVMQGRLCRMDGRPLSGTVKADANMPSHGHGMNYRTEVQRLANDGRFEVVGFLLHMPGIWEFEIKIVEQGKQDVLRFSHQAQ